MRVDLGDEDDVERSRGVDPSTTIARAHARQSFPLVEALMDRSSAYPVHASCCLFETRTSY